MPPGSGSIGDSVVSFEYDVIMVELSYQYGLTDKLSVGIRIPYFDPKLSDFYNKKVLKPVVTCYNAY
jgi:hypothetical protein